MEAIAALLLHNRYQAQRKEKDLVRLAKELASSEKTLAAYLAVAERHKEKEWDGDWE